MTIHLENCTWDIVDDAVWTKDWVGISSGDIFSSEQPYGHYVAAWYPNTEAPMVMIVTVLKGNPLQPSLSIGVRCPRGNLEMLMAVDPEHIPWEGDGVMFGNVTRLEDYCVYSDAAEALKLAPEIIRLDRSLRKYIYEPDLPVHAPS